MSRLQNITEEMDQIKTVNNLTGVFESIASLRIAQVKNQVVSAKHFFAELWPIYTQLRVDPQERITSVERIRASIDKILFIVVTAEGGLSGDIDEKLVDWMLQKFNPRTHDVIVIGHHGALQLAQKKVSIKQYFKLPEKQEDFDIDAIVKEIEKYQSTTVFYQTYVSLAVQDIASISLSAAVQELTPQSDQKEETISSRNYIFEPSTEEVISYLETVMLTVALNQVVLESRLAQYASRFNAMSEAHKKAKEAKKDLRVKFYRAKRALSDERTKEIMNSLKKINTYSNSRSNL